MGLKHTIPLCALLFLGCQREQLDDCITSAGPMRTEERITGGFHRIDLGDRIDLVFETRSSGTVSVQAGANLLGQITTEVSDGTLTVRNEMRCNWVRSFKPRITVHVPVAGMEHLTLRGTGDVSSTDTISGSFFAMEQRGAEGSCALLLQVDRTEIGLHSGAGNVSIRGRCTTANLFSGIMGAIDADELRADLVNINNSGIADIRCWAELQMNVGIYDVGDVYYRGDPPVIQSTITGSGSLIHVN
ncbi:MAG: DUF2807 domain-containing protein [Flavobacteriales bacterium]|nr:DUF2807 domain-containing protein [Flavobacteriales bacterium]MCC6937074.1 DUF2807 domain-containing protein [Flavobacteriales bacterium]